MSITNIRTILGIDALTCIVAGTAMSLGADVLTAPTGLHADLLLVAGCSLFPVAALFGWLSRTSLLNDRLVMLAVIGNFGWVAASMVMLLLAEPTPFGVAFVIAQASVVAVLAWLEFSHRPRMQRSMAA